MAKLIVIITFLTMPVGWMNAINGDTPEKPSLLELFEGRDELTFVDSSPEGVRIIGDDDPLVYCELRIKKSGKVYFNSYAYNFCRFNGTFQIIDGDIRIRLESFSDVFRIKGEPTPIKFPTLNLIHARDGVQLIRKDGERHLKEHWNMYEGVEIFPLILSSPASTEKQAEGADDQLPAHAELKAE